MRFRPRFSLKILLLFVAAVGSFCGYHVNWIRQRHNAPVLPAVATAIQGTPCGPREVTCEQGPPWPLGWFGERGYVYLGVDASYGEQEIERIRKLFPEAQVESIPSDQIEPEHRRKVTTEN
jgi:hypothetical protein